MILDRHIKYLRQIRYLPVQQAECFTTQGASFVLTSQESVTSILKLITGTKQVGGAVSAINDGFDWNRVILPDIDPTKNVGISVVWTKDTTGATALTSATWTVLYSLQALAMPGWNTISGGVGVGGTIITPATALSTAIAAQTVTGTDVTKVYTSPRGIIAANTLLAPGVPTAPTNGFWGIRLQLTAATAAFTNLVWVLGLLIDYEKRLTTGPGRYAPRQIHQNLLDVAPDPVFNPQ